MLVDNSIYRNAYVANGSSKSFAISFPFLTAEHIQVFRGVDDENDVLIPASEYTISGAGNENGGTLVMNTTPVSGTRIVILRNVPITQLYAYEELDNFSAKSHEDALAKLTMIDQQQQEQIDRSVKLPVTDPRTPEQYAQELFDAHEDVIGMPDRLEAQLVSIGNRYVLMLEEKVLALLGTANAFNGAAVAEIAEGMPEGSIIELPELMQYVVGSNTLMLFYNGTVGYEGQQYKEVGRLGSISRTVQVLHELRAGDMLQFRVIALHDYDVTATNTNMPRKLSDRFADVINVKDFGAKGDGATDDTAAFRAAANSVPQGEVGVFIPAGVYFLSEDPIERHIYAVTSKVVVWIIAPGVKFVGAGQLGDYTVSLGRLNNRWYGEWEEAAGRGFSNEHYAQQVFQTTSSPISKEALLLACQTKYSAYKSDHDGLFSAIVNNHEQYKCRAWAGYFEATQENPVVGATYGIEIGINNNSGQIRQVTSAAMNEQQTFGLLIESGSELDGAANAAASAAIYIAPGGQQFVKGIIFHEKSLVGANGLTGMATALELGYGHTISWTHGGLPTSSLRCFATDAQVSAYLSFHDHYTQFCRTGDNYVALALFHSPEMNAGLTIAGGVDAQGPGLQARGNADDVNLRLIPKGNGLLVFDTPAVDGVINSAAYIRVRVRGGGVVRIPCVRE